MSIQTSPVVAIGPIFPSGNIENGKLFLKIDGVNNGLYVCYNNNWLKIGKLTEVEPIVFNTPVNPGISLETAAVNPQSRNITFGGNF